MEIRRTKMEEQSGPRIIGPDTPCDCTQAVSYGGQCGHDLCYEDGNFVKGKWPVRFLQLQKLEMSRRTDSTGASKIMMTMMTNDDIYLSEASDDNHQVSMAQPMDDDVDSDPGSTYCEKTLQDQSSCIR
jgi:hypothetical protein